MGKATGKRFLNFQPFKNESDCILISDEFAIENRIERVSIFGSIDLNKDMLGLKHAREIRDVIDSIIIELEANDLPDAVKLNKKRPKPA